ncbi:MAG: rhomboid family intramembrane serine protease [Chitinophagaceae bacterium]
MSITLIIIVATVLASLPAIQNDELKDKFLFWPYMIRKKKEFFRFFTGAFFHADLMHLAFNMITLYSFGQILEKVLFPQLFGPYSNVLFILLYALGIVFAGVPDFFKYRNDYGYRALGASGAVSSVIFSAILLYPNMGLRFFFFPIDIPGWLFGILYLGISAYMAKRGGDNIGHSAHFWGGIFGLIYTFIAGLAIAKINLLIYFKNAILH